MGDVCGVYEVVCLCCAVLNPIVLRLCCVVRCVEVCDVVCVFLLCSRRRCAIQNEDPISESIGKRKNRTKRETKYEDGET